jgi:hypothetical protein
VGVRSSRQNTKFLYAHSNLILYHNIHLSLETSQGISLTRYDDEAEVMA